jgi:uncharacterized Zn finger protein
VGRNFWCRNCSKSRNHVGLWGNRGKHEETDDLVYRCTACGHLRTDDIVELEKRTTVYDSFNEDSTKTLSRDGFLSKGDTE